MREVNLHIHPGAFGLHVTVMLQRCTSSVTGTVETNDQHASRPIPVILLPEFDGDRIPDNMQLAIASTNGFFAFEAVRPGRYRLLALDNLKWTEGINPEVIAKYAGSGIAVEVEEHMNVSVRTRIVRAR